MWITDSQIYCSGHYRSKQKEDKIINYIYSTNNGAEVPHWGSIILEPHLLMLSSTLQWVFLRASLTALKSRWNKAVFSLSFFKLYSVALRASSSQHNRPPQTSSCSIHKWGAIHSLHSGGQIRPNTMGQQWNSTYYQHQLLIKIMRIRNKHHFNVRLCQIKMSSHLDEGRSPETNV